MDAGNAQNMESAGRDNEIGCFPLRNRISTRRWPERQRGRMVGACGPERSSGAVESSVPRPSSVWRRTFISQRSGNDKLRRTMDMGGGVLPQEKQGVRANRLFLVVVANRGTTWGLLAEEEEEEESSTFLQDNAFEEAAVAWKESLTRCLSSGNNISVRLLERVVLLKPSSCARSSSRAPLLD